MAGRGQGREVARLLRSELGLGTGYADIYQVIREVGIELYTHPFRDALDGAYKREQGRDFIFVNTSFPAPLRHRFTAAHELGHAQLRSVGEGGAVFEDVPEQDAGDGEEREASRFAAHFLMDERGVKELCSTIPDKERRVAATVHRFVVSATSAAIQLSELSLVSPEFKEDLLGRFRSEQDNTRSLLRRHKMVLPQFPDFGEQPRLDPRFEQCVLDAYETRWLRLEAVADLLQVSQGRAREILENNGLPDYEAELPEVLDPDLGELLDA